MALSYCKRRKLDVFKRVVHIVSVWDSKARDGKGGYVESVWPGIAELRTTAHRTSSYAGCDATVFGPTIEHTFEDKVGRDDKERIEKYIVRFPEWAQITVYRHLHGKRVGFPGPRVLWMETYATVGKSIIPNEMWRKRSSGQLEKCAEAAALRKAFPEELGNEIAYEELREIEDLTVTVPPRPTTASVQLAMDAKTAAEPAQEQETPHDEDGVVVENGSPGPVQAGDEGSDGFAVVGVDGEINWAGGDAEVFTAKLAHLMTISATTDGLMTLLQENAEDMKRVSAEQRQAINAAMTARMQQTKA
jgi:phage recombination protein Bet